MEQPSPEKIQELKAKYTERTLHLIEAVDGSDVYQFVMTGPSRDEYKKFTDEMFSARATVNEGDKLTALRGAIERAALAQIRWPARDDCQRLFESKPAMVSGFADELHKAAGNNMEFRSTKL